MRFLTPSSRRRGGDLVFRLRLGVGVAAAAGFVGRGLLHLLIYVAELHGSFSDDVDFLLYLFRESFIFILAMWTVSLQVVRITTVSTIIFLG